MIKLIDNPAKGESPMFKKLLCVIFAAIICVACAAPALADNGGYFTPFTVKVEAPTGTVLYDQVWNSDMTLSIMRPMSIFVPNGTALTVTGEREFEGEVYLAVSYKDFDAYIQRSKVSMMSDFAGDDLAFPTATEKKIAVINPDGIVMRKGPSLAYGRAVEKNIPYGTVLTYSHTNSKSKDDAQWAYTEYKGTAGWIYIFQCGVENIYDTARVLDGSDTFTGTVRTLTDGAFLTETPYAGSARVAENIPANTELSFRYYYDNVDYSVSVYVEHNGIKGWLQTMNKAFKVALGEKGGLYVLAENGLPMYEKPLDTTAQVIATLPRNTNLCVDMQHWFADIKESEIILDRWMHVNYNGTDGWVYCGNSNDCCYMSKAYDLRINADNISLYAEPSEDSQVLGTIAKDTSLSCAYEFETVKDNEIAYWSFVSHNGTIGWIFTTEAEASYVEGSEKQLDTPFEAEEINRASAENAPELKDGLPTNVIIIIVCAAAAVAAIVIVAVVIVKKNKK